MCDPTFIVSSALSSVGQIANVAKQSQDLNAQERYQNAIFKRNKEAADRAALQSSASIKRRIQQERSSAIQQIEENARRAILARSRARVAAGEAGGFGQSFDALLGSFAFREAEFASAVERNLVGRTDQLQAELQRIPLEQQSRINAFLPKPLPKPDYLGAGLRIAGSFAENFSEFKRREELRALR